VKEINFQEQLKGGLGSSHSLKKALKIIGPES